MVMNKQQIFDKVVLGLAGQNWEHSFDGQNCKYRLKKEGRTLKCAAGQLIPDVDYKPEFDVITNQTTKAYFTNFPHYEQVTVAGKYFASKFGALSCRFIDELQSIHDLICSQQNDFIKFSETETKVVCTESLKESLESYAAKNNLKWPIKGEPND